MRTKDGWTGEVGAVAGRRPAFLFRLVAVAIVPVAICIAGGCAGCTDYKAMHEMSVESASSNSISVETAMGAIRVSPAAGDKITARALVTARASSQDRAHELVAQTELRCQRVGEKVSIDAVTPKTVGNESVCVDVEVGVPWPKAAAGADTQPAAARTLECRSRMGSITISDLACHVVAQTNMGSVDIQGVAGPVEAKSSMGAVSVQNITGQMDLQSSMGAIEVRHASGAVVARTSMGAVEIKDVQGGVDVASSQGSIHVEDIRGDVKANASMGSVTVEKVDGDVQAHSNMGRVSISGATGKAISR